VHYGDFGGNASKILYVIGGLALTFLAASGLWIRLRPRRVAAVGADRRPAQNRATPTVSSTGPFP
jgi:uncharacterized iron-regulated membrane protein